MLSSTNFGKFVLVASLISLSSAHAFEGHLKYRHEILSLVPDCKIADQQLNWLYSLKPTRSEISDARNSIFFIGVFSKYFRENKDIANGTIKWAVNEKIREIMIQCTN